MNAVGDGRCGAGTERQPTTATDGRDEWIERSICATWVVRWMNSVLMQGVGPAAMTAGAPVATTGDFLAVLAEALAPSAPTLGVATASRRAAPCAGWAARGRNPRR